MKRLLLFFISLYCCLAIIGCGSETSTEDPEAPNINTQNTSATKLVEQKAATEAKEILTDHDVITNVKAINTITKLIIAVEIKHGSRFQLKKIKEELSKEMENHFQHFDVELTIDKKIFLELEKLEEKINSKTIYSDQLNKEVDQIIKLSKEKT